MTAEVYPNMQPAINPPADPDPSMLLLEAQFKLLMNGSSSNNAMAAQPPPAPPIAQNPPQEMVNLRNYRPRHSYSQQQMAYLSGINQAGTSPSNPFGIGVGSPLLNPFVQPVPTYPPSAFRLYNNPYALPQQSPSPAMSWPPSPYPVAMTFPTFQPAAPLRQQIGAAYPSYYQPLGGLPGSMMFPTLPNPFVYQPPKDWNFAEMSSGSLLEKYIGKGPLFQLDYNSQNQVAAPSRQRIASSYRSAPLNGINPMYNYAHMPQRRRQCMRPEAIEQWRRYQALTNPRVRTPYERMDAIARYYRS